jgi:hypothetical protein
MRIAQVAASTRLRKRDRAAPDAKTDAQNRFA